MRQLDILEVGVVPNGGILKSSDVSSISASDDIIRDTQTWASKRRLELEDELNTVRAEAREQAYREGLQLFLEAQANYATAIDGLSEKLEFLLRKSLHRVFAAWTPKQVLDAALKPLLFDLQKQAEVIIQVNPNSIRSVQQILQQNLHDVRAFTVEDDPSLNESDCVIFTEAEVIRVTIPVLVDQLVAAMNQYIKITSAAHQEEFSAKSYD